MATYLVANFLIRWDKKWKFYLNFLWHFHWQNWRKSGTKKTKDFFCDISSGKIYENLGLKSKRIFLWLFQWRKSRTSRTTKGKDYFLNLLWHLQWQNSQLPWKKWKEFFWHFQCQNHKISWTNVGKFLFIFCDISSGYFGVYLGKTRKYIF